MPRRCAMYFGQTITNPTIGCIREQYTQPFKHAMPNENSVEFNMTIVLRVEMFISCAITIEKLAS